LVCWEDAGKKNEGKKESQHKRRCRKRPTVLQVENEDTHKQNLPWKL